MLNVAGSRPLTLLQKVSFGIGDFGGTLFFQATLLYLVYFYTDVALIAPASVATILLLARCIDAASCPIIGSLADLTRTRWGRFRPYVLFGAIPLAVSCYATFTVWPGQSQYSIVYAVLSYALFSICFAAVAIPYSALLGTLTLDSRERTILGTLRAGCSFSAGIVVSVAMLPLIRLTGGGQVGFHYAIAAMSLLAVPILWTTFAFTRERVEPAKASPPTPLDTIRAISTRPMLSVILIFVIASFAMAVRSAGALYFFKYNLGRADLASLFLTSFAVTTVLGILMTPLISARLGKRSTLICGAFLATVGHAVMSFAPSSVVATFLWVGFLSGIGMGLKIAVTWPLIADCIDFAEWKRGKRVEGAVYGLAIFGQKLALALGGALTGLTLSATGYVANAVQSPYALGGIKALMAYYPGGAMLACLGLAVFYPLTERKMEEIHTNMPQRG